MVMDLVTIEAWFIGWLVLGRAVGIIAHEAGHAVMARAVGFPLRLITIGVGRIVLRRQLGEAWLVLRAVPISGYVMYLPQPQNRRIRRALVTAGGPLANLLLLALAGMVYLMRPAAFWDEHLMAQAPLLGFSVAQASILITVLIPAHGKLAGRRFPTDGLKLWRLVTRPADGALPQLHAKLIRDVLPPRAISPLSRHSAEIVFQASRPDRWRDAWAARDAADAMRGILQQDGLPGPERALLLSVLVAGELLFGSTGAELADLDAWSQQALDLAPFPQQSVFRGGVLVALGRYAEADTMLQTTAEGHEKGVLPVLARAFLAQAAAKQGADGAAAEWMRRARASVTKALKPVLLPILARLETGIAPRGYRADPRPVTPAVAAAALPTPPR